jgi:N utilization substance protein B
VVAEFLAHRIGAEDGANGGGGADADPDLFRRLVGAAVNWQARIDQATDRALVAAWPLNRIDPVLRAIFRAAGAELVLAETPPRAVLGGFVDIARWFCGEGPETGFVNAVLEHMARDMAPDAFASA